MKKLLKVYLKVNVIQFKYRNAVKAYKQSFSFYYFLKAGIKL